MTFIEFIRTRGFTIQTLAEKSAVSRRSLEDYTCGRRPLRNARAWFIVSVAEALDTTPKFLIEELDEPNTD